MVVVRQSRDTLRSYFVTNAIPTEGQFAELIASMINQLDDGVSKQGNSPLSIQAAGVGAVRSDQPALQLCTAIDKPAPEDWYFSLTGHGRKGLNIRDGNGFSRLFIDQEGQDLSDEEGGYIGIGTTSPTYKLDVADRMKVRSGPRGTAGIMFHQDELERGFVGMKDKDNIGLGGANSRWSLVSNVNTGDLDIRGDVRLNDKNLYLRGDTNHGIGWYGAGKLFNNINIDGPVVFGASGGALGTAGAPQRIALQWNRDNNVTINGKLNLSDETWTNDKNLYLRGDTNHGIGWYGTGKLFNNVNIDGPVVFGASGGALGTKGAEQRIALQWKADNKVTILGKLDLKDDSWLNDKNLYLRGDSNHGIGWCGVANPFGSIQVDGPIVFGYSGGALGTTKNGKRGALTWDDSGNVTTIGYLASKQVYFSAYLAANDQAGTHDPLPMMACDVNEGGGYNTTTSKFTAPVKGVYLFTLTACKSVTTDHVFLYLKVNGGDYHRSLPEATECTILSFIREDSSIRSRSFIFTLNRGDTVHVKQDAGPTGQCDNYRTSLEGILIAALS